MTVRRTVRYKPKPQSERDFQAQIITAAKLYGWLVYHTYDSRRCEPGFPDLILIRGGVLLAIELKTATGRVRSEQRQWLDAFAGVTRVESHLIRPADWNTLLAKLER